MLETFTAPDGVSRCSWCAGDDQYIHYHDNEWGYPVTDDIRLFEKICLEGFQSGLSWLTILRKRENFRSAFAGFDFHKVAQFDQSDVDRLLGDAGIIRHRGKIEAAINNAGRAIELVAAEGSIANYVWSYFDPTDQGSGTEWRATSPASVALSKDLKKRGWKFVGPTTMYAFLQSMGVVNDHAEGCVMRAKAAEASPQF